MKEKAADGILRGATDKMFLERSHWGWSVVCGDSEVGLFEKKSEAIKFISDHKK